MRRLPIRVSLRDCLDVAVYTLVLVLFTTFFPQVISESFLVSLITAILLKIVLEIAISAKTRVIARIKSATTRTQKIVSVLCLALVGGGSKALVLWLTDVVLGDAVNLGGFLSVTLLVVALMLCRAGVSGVVNLTQSHRHSG